MKWSILALMLMCCKVAAGEFTFAVIGDTRPRFESESFLPFERLIGKINQAGPALVVNLGDLIYGYGPARKERQWDKYLAVAGTIDAPYYQVPGNHDTHSKAARTVYQRRFGKCYQSFDYDDCHFVLLDNTEDQRWGYIGPAQLDWLRRDLAQFKARRAFVFVHFPVWEADRITPEYYQFWSRTLHPLFKQSRVQAVFGGHYHTYGPTREFDGIRYFITGGGGAELRPEYRKSGGQYHFMKVFVRKDALDVRVVTERGELSDPEADVLGGLQFAARNVSRIGIRQNPRDLTNGISFNVSVENPYADTLIGTAEWILDPSAFVISPPGLRLAVAPHASQQYRFTLRAPRQLTALPSLPRLEFDLTGGGKAHRFHREVRFLRETKAPYCRQAPRLDGQLNDWTAIPALNLQRAPLPAEMRACYDAQNLYLAVSIPSFDEQEAKEFGFSDQLQLGLSKRTTETDFGPDLLRLGLNPDAFVVRDRTPGRTTGLVVKGAGSFCSKGRLLTTYEVCLPLKSLPGRKPAAGDRLILDLSFAAEDRGPAADAPAANSLAYRVRYGSDSLAPVYFVELNLQPKP